jgi:hypothetical protein
MAVDGSKVRAVPKRRRPCVASHGFAIVEFRPGSSHQLAFGCVLMSPRPAAAELWGLCARPPAIEIGRGARDPKFLLGIDGNAYVVGASKFGKGDRARRLHLQPI